MIHPVDMLEIYCMYIRSGMEKACEVQAGIFPLNPQTLFAENSQSHRKSKGMQAKF